MMRKIWKCPRDVIQCIRPSNCSDNLFIIYFFLQKKFHFKRTYAGTFDISRGLLSNVTISNVISLVSRDTDTDSENVSLIRCSVSDRKKTVHRVYQ